jgi:DNA replication protein DnaC
MLKNKNTSFKRSSSIPELVQDKSLPNARNYLEEVKKEIGLIEQQYAKSLSNEKELFSILNEKIDELLIQLQSDHLSSRLLYDVVIFIESIMHQLKRELGASLLNPNSKIQLLFEKGNSLLMECGILESTYGRIKEVTRKMIDSEQLLAQTQKNLQLNKNFHNLLSYIKNTFPKKYSVKKIFVSYAWPKEDKLHEHWTKEFVEILSEHLHEVGLIVYDDQHESGAGKVLHWFMDDKIEEVDHVLVISSRTMAYKYWEDGFSGACNEYTDYIERFRRERGERFIIPILLNEQNNSPGFVRKFAELSFYSEGYLRALLDLICKLYDIGKIDKEVLYNQVQLCNQPPDEPLSKFLNNSPAPKSNTSIASNDSATQTNTTMPSNKVDDFSSPIEQEMPKDDQSVKKEPNKSKKEKSAPIINIQNTGNLAVFGGSNRGTVFSGTFAGGSASLLTEFGNPAFSKPEKKFNKKKEKEKELEVGSINLKEILKKLQNAIEMDVDKEEQQYYIPVQGCFNNNYTNSFELYTDTNLTETAAKSSENEKLTGEVNKFLCNDKKNVLLLLGNSGAGKTMFCHFLSDLLCQQQDKVIVLYITLGSFDDPSHNLIEQYLQRAGLKEKEIKYLRKNHKFVFILDGYDEMSRGKGLHQNLYATNHFEQWQAKIIISCRSSFLINAKDYRLDFYPLKQGKSNAAAFTEITLVPFSENQIKRYISVFLKNPPAEVMLERSDLEEKWQNPQTYLDYIDILPGLKTLISTPFLLRILMEVLPHIVADYQSVPVEERLQLTVTTLYDYFFKNYYIRQAAKLAQQGKLPEDGHSLIDDFAEYSKQLAINMWEKEVTQITYWRKSTLFSKSEPDPWEIFLGNSDPEMVRAREGCPIKQLSAGPTSSGDVWIGFFHNSFRDYLAVREIFEKSLTMDLEAIKALTEISSITDSISQITIKDEPSTQYGIHDMPPLVGGEDEEKEKEKENSYGLQLTRKMNKISLKEHQDIEKLTVDISYLTVRDRTSPSIIDCNENNTQYLPPLIGSDDEEDDKSVYEEDEEHELERAIQLSLGK